MEEKKPQITLFGKIDVADSDTLNLFLSDLDYDQSIYVLCEAVTKAYDDGVFSLVESELISKAIRIIYQNKTKKTEE